MSEIQEKLLLSDCKEKNSIAYSIIFEIENKLRLIILHKMDEENEKWWDELNGKYINRIEEIKTQEDQYLQDALIRIKKNIYFEKDNNYKHIILTHDIYYTNLKDLYLIIKRYWNGIFSQFFTKYERNEFYWQFERTIKIRNKIMHSKPITKWEIEQIDGFNKYINGELSKTRIDTTILTLYLSLSELINQINEEVNYHLSAIDSSNYDELLITKIPDKYQNEWWWKSSLFKNYKRHLESYYLSISKVNEAIKSYINGSGKLYEIDNAIQDSDLMQLSDNLFAVINDKSERI